MAQMLRALQDPSSDPSTHVRLDGSQLPVTPVSFQPMQAAIHTQQCALTCTHIHFLKRKVYGN